MATGREQRNFGKDPGLQYEACKMLAKLYEPSPLFAPLLNPCCSLVVSLRGRHAQNGYIL